MLPMQEFFSFFISVVWKGTLRKWCFHFCKRKRAFTFKMFQWKFVQWRAKKTFKFIWSKLRHIFWLIATGVWKIAQINCISAMVPVVSFTAHAKIFCRWLLPIWTLLHVCRICDKKQVVYKELTCKVQGS